MTARRRTQVASLATQLGAIALAAPQVVAHRTARMAASGMTPSASDQREMRLMVDEKTRAFGSSWLAMGMQMAVAQQRMAMWWMRACFTPWSIGRTPAAFTNALQGAALDVMSRGVTPIRRTAVANAKRLSRSGHG